MENLDDANIVRKIISMLPHNKYENIIVIIYNIKVLSTMTLTLVNGKLVAFEMSCNMGQEEDTSPRKVITLTCDEHKIKGKKQVETSSSSSSEEEGEEDDDQVFTPHLILMMEQSNKLRR